MRLTTSISYLIKRKIATAVLVLASVGAFATLGDDGGKKNRSGALAERATARSFSLRPTYGSFRNTSIFQQDERKFIMVNSVVTYQKGNTTYVMPLKKRVLLDKVKFNPAPARF